MGLIERYLFSAALAAFLAGLFGLTGVIWVALSLREVDLMTTKGQSLWVFLTLTGLTIPSLVLVIAPFALFLAIVYVLNRLNSDSELIVMSASGLPPRRLFFPFAGLTLLVVCLIGAISFAIMPWSFRAIRSLASNIKLDFLTRVVREGTFVSLEKGFVFHYRERSPTGALLGVFMQDRRDTDQITSYIAERGETISAEGRNLLLLKNGSVQRQKAGPGDAAIVVFDSYAIDLSQFSAGDAAVPIRPRERTTWDLLHLDHADPLIKWQEGRLRAELHDRFVSPLYALAFGIIAFAALSQARTTRQGRGTAVAVALLAIVVLRLAGFGASTLIVRDPKAVILVYAVPCLGFLAGWWAAFGPPLAMPAWLRAPVARLKWRLS
jgi:lipopolysaccharide export system permease protein